MDFISELSEFISHLPKEIFTREEAKESKDDESGKFLSRKRCKKNRKGLRRRNGVNLDGGDYGNKIADIDELHKKIQEKLASFRTNKGKRSQKKREREMQRDKDKGIVDGVKIEGSSNKGKSDELGIGEKGESNRVKKEKKKRNGDK